MAYDSDKFDSDKFVNSLSSRYTGIIWYVVHFGVGFVYNC